MTDNLAGQLWFGAECLAAGSSIMNKETESEAMRPLAKAVTKSLEKVRKKGKSSGLLHLLQSSELLERLLLLLR